MLIETPLPNVAAKAAARHLGRDPLPAPLRAGASFCVLDATEWFGDTSGGIRTYLLQKGHYVASRRTLRQVLVVPGAQDAIDDGDGVRTYRLAGPRIPGQAPYRFMLSGRKLGRIMRHERPDLIEVGSPFIVPWLVQRANRRLDVPIIAYYHSNLPRLFSSRGNGNGAAGVGRALESAAWRYMRALHRPLALTIASSRYSVRELQRAGIENVVHVPLGVDLELFQPTRRSSAEATRQRLGIPAGKIAGFIGRFAAEKELPMLLDAWHTVEQQTGARLVLVGAGPLETRLRAHPYAARVTFLPFTNSRTDVADLLAALDLYIAPGRVETFGLSSLEALASGTPLLAANTGGVAEQVEHSGAGATFEAGDSQSLSEQAINLLSRDPAALGVLGRQYAESEHSWTRVFDRVFAVYAGVVANRGRRA
jgi:alpha-1,6-mannosyltransferase